jgi:cytochrome b561
LTKTFGVIVLIISVARVAIIFVEEKVRASAPQALEGLRALGGVLFVTIVSLMACVFGMSLMRGKSGFVEYWPLGIVLIFGLLAAYCIRNLWHGWQMYRRMSRGP